MEKERESIWLVVFDDYSMYQPEILGFKTLEQAIKYFKEIVEDILEEEITEDDLDLMAHEYNNGVVYITSVDITEGEKILPRQRNRTVDESARLICNGESTLDDRINISEMVDSIIFMMASAYRKGCSDAEKKECA